jgi:hypothetical protein
MGIGYDNWDGYRLLSLSFDYADQSSAPQKIFDRHATLESGWCVNNQLPRYPRREMASTHRHLWEFDKPISFQSQGLYAVVQ